MTMNWQFRPNTQDEDIHREVYVENCYQLPDDMSGITVIDIGANIGCFTVACLERGAEYVIAFEPDPGNFRELEINVYSHSRSNRVGMFNSAVLKECKDTYLSYMESRDGTLLTGGRRVSSTWNEQFNLRVSSVSIEQAVELASCSPVMLVGRYPIWLKLDCEGAEYQILSCDLPWDRIERIFGECHDYRDGKFSRYTNPVEVTPDAFGGLEPNRGTLANRLLNCGYVVEVVNNPVDDRLSLFFASKQKIINVAVLTPFRNARRYLPLYFEQISSLKGVLEKENMKLRLVAAEGDSLDNTRERIIELASEHNIPLEIVDTTHGHMRWGSVEDPVRMKVMSDVMNKALEKVFDSDDVVVWIMSDLKWEPEHILSMIKRVGETGSINAPLALVSKEGQFYDTWAFRKDNKRFYAKYPFHESFEDCCCMGNQVISASIDSAGTCLVMPAKIARECRADQEEAVSFCANARSRGYQVVIHFDVSVIHNPNSKARILWIGDAVCVSGFSRVSHNILPILSEAGYEVDVIATNYGGFPHNYPYLIWPAGEDSGTYLAQQLVYYADKQGKQYDAVIVLDDPWNVPRITRALEDLREKVENLPPTIAWVTVDGRNIRGGDLNGFDYVLSASKFGAEELIVGGFGQSIDNLQMSNNLDIVPFGVNTEIYRPLDKLESRKVAYGSNNEIPEDAYIIGTVSTNQLRKRLDLVLKYFAEWVEGIDNAYLYLCLGASNHTGCDVISLIRYYGLRKKVIINTSLLSEPTMAHVYNSFDVFVSLSQGEGFGLCALEAMACGVPCVLSDWSGYSSWVPNDCAIKVPCTSTALSSPLNSQAYVIGGVADLQGTINALQKLYMFPNMREILRAKGLSLAKQFSWKNSGEKLLNVIEQVVERKHEKVASTSLEEKSA